MCAALRLGQRVDPGCEDDQSKRLIERQQSENQRLVAIGRTAKRSGGSPRSNAIQAAVRGAELGSVNWYGEVTH